MTVAPDPSPDDQVAAHARRLVAETEAELRAIEGSLGRLEEGTYGRCAVCGGAIEAARLEERPSERYCAEHAEGAK